MYKEIYIEFLEIALHYVLYASKIYPDEVFENRKKYGTSVKYSIHPKINEYLKDCLLSARELLNDNALDKVVFCVLDSRGFEVRRFVFSVFETKNEIKDQDHYLIKCEQSLRAFFLKMSTTMSFESIPDSSFTILLHTTETGGVRLAKCPELEHFPCIEREEPTDSREYYITPINTMNIDVAKVQVYLEQPEMK